MKMGAVFVLVLMTVMSQAQDGNTAITQDPPGIVTVGTRVMFSCQALGIDVSWLVGGVRTTSINDGFTVTTHHSNDSTTTINSVLTITRVKANDNNTEVTCIMIHGTDPNLTYINRTIHLLIAAPPLPPFMRLAVFSNGSGLRAQWYRPFVMPGYPVTSYTLTFVNKSNGVNFKEILEEDLISTTYDLTVSDVSTECHPLTFTVFATNSVGDSSLSNSVTIGFPIFPRTDHVVLHVDLNISPEGSPILITTFQVPTICSYQEPAMYTIDIIDDRGDLVNSTGLLSANVPANDYVTNIIHATLDRGQTYSAELIILHEHVPGEAFATFLGIDYPFLETESTTSMNTAVQCSEPAIMLAIVTMALNIILS